MDGGLYIIVLLAKDEARHFVIGFVDTKTHTEYSKERELALDSHVIVMHLFYCSPVHDDE